VELQQKLATVTSGNFLLVDVDGIRHTALALPWVSSVNVQRVWPDTLRVSITEHVAAATWIETGAEAATGLLSTSGRLFTPELASYPDRLPTISGPHDTHGALLGHYQAMNQTLLPLGLRITHLTQDARRAFHLTLDNGIELALGRSDSYARLMRFVYAWPVLQAPGTQPAVIDLRYSNGLAVRWLQQESGENTAATGRNS
jgi:cell division protein FtsQ